MIISCKQLLQMRAIDPNAFKDVVFQKYNGTNGACVATVDGPMDIEGAVAYAHECEEAAKAKPAAEKPASGSAYKAAGSQ